LENYRIINIKNLNGDEKRMMPKDPSKVEAYLKRQSEIMKKYFDDPWVRKKNSETQKKVQGTPEARKRRSDATKKRYEDNPDMRKKASITTKKQFEIPGAKEKTSKAIKKYYADNPEARKELSEIFKKVKNTPEARKINSEAQKKVKGTFEDRKRNSETQKIVQKKIQSTPEARRKNSEAQKKRYSDLWWMGSVKYYDGPQYCEKWTSELRERVRAFFNNTCAECGAPQNGKKLHVHHVWYNKKLCCDDTPRSLILLCAACHAKTSALKGKKREEFSIHFQEIIDTQYDGRCWMSKEEFAEFKKKK
jgi:hypothetical protein